MTRNAGILFSLFLILLSTGMMQAQEVENPYADVPMTRTLHDSFVLGNPDAKVKLIEFSDFLCTSCQNYKPIIDHFIQEYVLTGQAQFTYRIFPTVDLELSVLSAGLVECADFLADRFWQAHDLMFDIASAQGFTESSITAFASQLGLDEAELRECAGRATQYRFDVALGTELGVKGTPSLFVQYGDDPPVAIALALPEQYDAVVNAIRPQPAPPAIIEIGQYAGIATYRRPDGGFVLGEPDAPLALVAFEDFLCPHCQNYQTTLQSFIDQYVRTGQARFEYRFFPLVHPQYSTLTAQIAECVGLQDVGKFWEAHDLLFGFASAGELDEDIANKIARLVDVDADALDSCVGRSMQYLIDVHLGQQAGVSGTPGMRAWGRSGQLEVIYAGQQAFDRGAVPLEVLNALAEGSSDASIGQPFPTLLHPYALEGSSLISGEPCGPPCWQNMTPGVTTMEEARAAAEALGATIYEIETETQAAFAFAFSDEGLCCFILPDEDGNLVDLIALLFSGKLTVGDIIAVYGDPSYVDGEALDDVGAALRLFYPQHNLTLYAVIDSADSRLKETTPIYQTMYASEDLMADTIESTPLDNWKGYIKFSEYMDGEFDRQP